MIVGGASFAVTGLPVLFDGVNYRAHTALVHQLQLEQVEVHLFDLRTFR